MNRKKFLCVAAAITTAAALCVSAAALARD
jgi:hypothetical protein